MLGKLIKHEFRATGRLMAPLFGALLLLAVFVRVSDLVLRRADAPVFFEALNALLLVVYVLAILGVTVFARKYNGEHCRGGNQLSNKGNESGHTCQK